MGMNKSLGNPSLGLQLRQFLGAASSVVQGNIGQIAQIHTLSLVEGESVVAGNAGTLIILGLAGSLADRADSVTEGISGEAGSAGSTGIVSLTGRGDSLAGSIDQHVVLAAGQAHLVVPVPVSTPRISGLINSPGHTAAVDYLVSLVAGQAGTSGTIVGLALRVHGHAYSVGEEPVGRAGKAGLFCPVPLGTPSISGEAVASGEHAGSIFQFQGISIVATSAGQSLICLTEIRNSSADIVGVEGPVLRTVRADTVGPLVAPRISGRSQIGGREQACSVDQVVSEVAGQTGTVGGLKGLAESGRLSADALQEVPSLRADIADIGSPVPDLAARIGNGSTIR
jgi:hypothetical protein